MVMKYSFLFSVLIVALSLQFSAGGIVNNAHEQHRPNQLRGSLSTEEDGERSLDGSSSYYSQGNNGYRNGNNGYGGGNSNYANGHYNNYRNRGYYARRHYYYPHRGYYGYAKGQYYGYDDQYYGDSENEEDEVDDIVSSRESGHDIASEVEEQFWEWYDSPPADWTPAQWAWFSGLLSLSVGFLFCCCLGFANICVEGQEKVCCCCCGDSDYNDAYRSIDREKSGSFMTINSKASNISTTGGSTNMSLNTTPSDDDDATYDSIMRMRSASSN